MAYDGQSIVDLDITRPDGDAEPKSILDDVTKETKRALKQTPYSWAEKQNISGDNLILGDVVALGGVEGLIIDDTVGGFRKYVVLVENISNAAVGLVARSGGPVQARAAGAVTSYNYVRKSATTKAFEDMGIPVVSDVVLPNEAIGFSLESVAGPGLCDIFLYEHTVAAPTELKTHVLELINRTGVVVAKGAVVSPDPDNDNSVVLNDVKGTLRPVLVAFESIPNITLGRWIQNGACDVLVQGPVPRMHYLRKSATSMVLETTGVSAASITQRPPGTVGIALATFAGSGVGLCQVLLFGATADVSTMSLPRVTNLVGVFVDNSTRSYTGQRACLLNPLDGSTITLPLSGPYINDTNINGRGGRDQSNTFNPNTYIYYYLTWDGTTLATRSSINPPSIGPSLASGETHFVLLDVIRRNASSIMSVVSTFDDWSYYLSPQQISLISVIGVELTMVTSGLVPPGAPEFDLTIFGQAEIAGANAGGYTDFDLRILPGTIFRRARLGITGVSDGNTKRDGLHMNCRIPNTGYLAGMWTVATGSVPTVTAATNLVGYKNPS